MWKINPSCQLSLIPCRQPLPPKLIISLPCFLHNQIKPHKSTLIPPPSHESSSSIPSTDKEINLLSVGTIKSFALTYSRRKVLNKIIGQETPTHQPFIPNSSNRTELQNHDIPVALKKGTKICTKHPISDFLDKSHLARSMQTFLTHLSENWWT